MTVHYEIFVPALDVKERHIGILHTDNPGKLLNEGTIRHPKAVQDLQQLTLKLEIITLYVEDKNCNIINFITIWYNLE